MSQSVHAALQVLGAVAEHPGLGLSELARLTEMNKSRTYRMLTALAEDGYVDQDSDGTYHLGIQALVIGQAARTSIDLVRSIEAAVEDQMKGVDENIQARQRDGLEVVQIFSRKSRQQLQVTSAVGNRRPLGKGASGRLLLAHAPDDVRRAAADAGGDLPGEDELTQILEQGYAETTGELTTGVWAIAVPIVGSDGHCTTCLSVSVPSVRRTDAYRDELIAALTRTTDALGAVHTSTTTKES